MSYLHFNCPFEVSALESALKHQSLIVSGMFEAALQFIVRLQFLIVTIQLGYPTFIGDLPVCAAR